MKTFTRLALLALLAAGIGCERITVEGPEGLKATELFGISVEARKIAEK